MEQRAETGEMKMRINKMVSSEMYVFSCFCHQRQTQWIIERSVCICVFEFPK